MNIFNNVLRVRKPELKNLAGGFKVQCKYIFYMLISGSCCGVGS